MLNITHHQGNVNQNDEISLHIHWNGEYQNDKKQVLVRLWKKGNSCTLLGGTQIGAVTMYNSMEVLQKIKNRTTI